MLYVIMPRVAKEMLDVHIYGSKMLPICSLLVHGSCKNLHGSVEPTDSKRKIRSRVGSHWSAHAHPSHPGSAAVRLPALRHSCPRTLPDARHSPATSRNTAINICGSATQLHNMHY